MAADIGTYCALIAAVFAYLAIAGAIADRRR